MSTSASFSNRTRARKIPPDHVIFGDHFSYFFSVCLYLIDCIFLFIRMSRISMLDTVHEPFGLFIILWKVISYILRSHSCSLELKKSTMVSHFPSWFSFCIHWNCACNNSCLPVGCLFLFSSLDRSLLVCFWEACQRFFLYEKEETVYDLCNLAFMMLLSSLFSDDHAVCEDLFSIISVFREAKLFLKAEMIVYFSECSLSLFRIVPRASFSGASSSWPWHFCTFSCAFAISACAFSLSFHLNRWYSHL